MSTVLAKVTRLDPGKTVEITRCLLVKRDTAYGYTITILEDDLQTIQTKATSYGVEPTALLAYYLKKGMESS